MRKIILAVFLAASLLSPRTARAEDQFSSYGIQQAGKLLANPPLFFYEFQRNMESTFPLPAGKVVGVDYHMLGGILIIPLPDWTTAYNVSAKARVHREGQLLPGLPQVDLVGGQWKTMSFITSKFVDKNAKPTDSGKSKVTALDLDGHYVAAVVSSSLEPRVRLFWSYKVSRLNIDMRLNKPENVLGSQVQGFTGRLSEQTFAAGLEHTYAAGNRWIIEGGYGVKNHLLTAKVAWSGRVVELGVNIYPESVFVMQPELNFHVYF